MKHIGFDWSDEEIAMLESQRTATIIRENSKRME